MKNKTLKLKTLILILSCTGISIFAANTTRVSATELSTETTPQQTVNTEMTAPTIHDGSSVESTGAGTSLPATYDSRTKGVITSVKNQGSFNDCWAFATMGTAEANIISKGMATNSLDLSELQLAYFMYHTPTDPLGLTAGDSTNALKSDFLNNGGYLPNAVFELASWTDIADEATVPYTSASTSMTLDNSLAFNDVYHLQNAYFINLTDTDDVKQAIIDHGAVGVQYYSEGQDAATVNPWDAWNSTTHAYYNGGYTASNHTVSIVGWDDNYDISNFNSQNRPTANGAWLVKNSWGTSWGDNGYFWLSYYDGSLSGYTGAIATVFDFESADNYQHNYQYDGSTITSRTNVTNGDKIANVFTAKANTGKAESINAIAFGLGTANVDYSIQIYKNVKDPALYDPETSGTPILAAPQTGTTSYAGYYTIKLDNPAVIRDGDTFMVIITLSKANTDTIWANVDWNYSATGNTAFVSADNTHSYGLFTMNATEKYWLPQTDMTYRIKAFTDDTDITNATSVSLNQTSLDLKPNNTATLSASVAPANAYDTSVTWTSSNNAVATVDTSGNIKATGCGTAVITAKTYNNLTATCTVTVKQLNIANYKINLSQTSYVYDGKEKKPTVSIDGLTLNKDYIVLYDDNSDIGTASVTVDGQGDIIGEQIVYFKITKPTLSDTSSANIGSCTYDGTAKTPSITIKYNGKKLVLNKDFKIYYSNNTKPGIATVVIKGKGNYTGKITKTFVIKPQKVTAKASGAKKAVNVSFAKSAGASKYAVYMSTSKKGKYTQVGTTKSTSLKQKGLKSKKTYYFKVRAYVNVGSQIVYSSYSNVVSAKTK